MPTEEQISAAHKAWEDMVYHWRVKQYGRVWVVEPYRMRPNDPSKPIEPGHMKYHRFDDEKSAKFFFRDMILKAVLQAAELEPA